MLHVDLNSDLGEGYGAWRLGDDVAMLDLVTSANVACGFHAGDPTTMRRTVDAAVDRGVRIGAQVSYPDVVGFGRRRMDVDPDDLTADVLYQIGALDAFCRGRGSTVTYVKPHGALYNRIVDDELQAAAVVAAIRAWQEPLSLLTLADSVAAEVAESSGVTVVAEGFADRGYREDGRLVPRQEAGALITDPDVVAERALRLVTRGTVTAVGGKEIRVRIQSLCVHGDTPGAVALASAIRAALLHAAVDVRAFT